MLSFDWTVSDCLLWELEREREKEGNTGRGGGGKERKRLTPRLTEASMSTQCVDKAHSPCVPSAPQRVQASTGQASP